MTKADQERQMVKGIRECEERTKIKEMERRKWAEMSRLLAEHRALAVKLSESFLRLQKELKP